MELINETYLYLRDGLFVALAALGLITLLRTVWVISSENRWYKWCKKTHHRYVPRKK